MASADSSHYRGVFRRSNNPSCTISVQDLRRLYADLSEKAGDALEKHIASVQKPESTNDEDWEALKERVREIGRLTAIVIGENGEQNVGQSATPLEEDQLPDRIVSVTFDSYSALQRENITPLNRFRLALDFTEPPAFGVYNPWDVPTPNGSSLEVTGADSTWATGVYESVLGFFRARARRRGWLHSPITFNLLNWLVGMPAALWIVYRLDAVASQFFSSIDAVLRGAIYVYIVLVVLLVFRLVIGGFRWTFPVVELQGARSSAVRRSLNVALSSLVLALGYDVIRTLVWR